MKKNVFTLPYIGIEDDKNFSIIYNQRGDYGVTFKINNPVVQFSANPENYNNGHSLFINILKILGEGFLLQKQDVFIKKIFKPESSPLFLQDKFNHHFEGRSYIDIETYLSITKKNNKTKLYIYSEKEYLEFINKISKIKDLLNSYSKTISLNQKQFEKLIKKTLTMDFFNEITLLSNINVGDYEIRTGKKTIRNISLINVDDIELPPTTGTYVNRNDSQSIISFPTDIMSFLINTPLFETIIYNQIVNIPNQIQTKNKLELKKKRHLGIPDAANLTAAEDIIKMLEDIEKENQILVQAHYNIVLCAENQNIDKATNFIAAQLFKYNIIPSNNSYNQLELFRTVLPNNATELKNYDYFLTTADAAVSFFFKESLEKSEQSDFSIQFTDRYGIPIEVDILEKPMLEARTNNRNKFVLGGSGTGKSFLTNNILEQYTQHNQHQNPKWLMDVIIIDVGHSYKRLCIYKGGKYITFPITANPFNIKKNELFYSNGNINDEKKEFFLSLIILLWLGSSAKINQIETDIISNTIIAFYKNHFSNKTKTRLCFDSFYNFSCNYIPALMKKERVDFDINTYKYVLKKFLSGNEYGNLLNEDIDNSLFDENFIVFEIDSIQNNKILFPIVTLIIMDLYLQKIRYRSGRRKCLIIEEAWKAIASPVMQQYIIYMYKTVRKFFGEVGLVTQSLADIIGNEVVRDAILENSDIKILLDQSKNLKNFDTTAKFLGLSEIEKNKIFTINRLDNKDNRPLFKEFYLARGITGEVYGNEISFFQYLTFTTEKDEVEAIDLYFNKINQDYEKTLNFLVNDFTESKLKSFKNFVSVINKIKTPFSDPEFQKHLKNHSINEAVSLFISSKNEYQTKIIEYSK